MSNNTSESSANDKYATIVEYLKSNNKKLSNEDFIRDLGIDIEEDYPLINMLKSNPKIEAVYKSDDDDDLTFQYINSYEIKNLIELKNTINRVRNGIIFTDIENCYNDILSDCKELIVSGEYTMACKNKDKKTFVLYPRGKPFYTQLSGDVTAIPGRNLITTTSSLKDEIRRGDAICVGDSWYRVSCSVGSGRESQQSERSTAPLTVTSEKELSDKNIYFDQFTNEILPLDGAYDGDSKITTKARRHGCTNDVRKIWNDSLIQVKRFRSDDDIEKELLHLKLITKLSSKPISNQIIKSNIKKRSKFQRKLK